MSRKWIMQLFAALFFVLSIISFPATAANPAPSESLITLDNPFHIRPGGVPVSLCLATGPVITQPVTGGNAVIKIANAIFQPIGRTLATASSTLENNIRNYAIPLLQAVLVLYLVIYGLMVALQMTQVSWSDAVVRVIKIGLIFTAVSSAPFMSGVVREFFAGGMNELINIYATATGLNTGCGITTNSSMVINPNVLCAIFAPLSTIFSVNFLTGIVASFFSGYGGPALMVFMILGIFVFLMTMLAILMTYLKAVILLFIMLGLAPLFFVALVFQSTRNLFEAWLGLTLSFALQPVFLVAFFGFFTQIMTASLDNIVSNRRMCYATIWSLGIIDIKWWFYTPWRSSVPACTSPGSRLAANASCPDSAWITDSENPWAADDLAKPHNENLTKHGPSLRDVLMFIAVCLLCFRYTDYIEQIAKELTGGGIGIGSDAGRVGAAVAAMGIMDPSAKARSLSSNVAGAAGSGFGQAADWVNNKFKRKGIKTDGTDSSSSSSTSPRSTLEQDIDNQIDQQANNQQGKRQPIGRDGGQTVPPTDTLNPQTKRDVERGMGQGRGGYDDTTQRDGNKNTRGTKNNPMKLKEYINLNLKQKPGGNPKGKK